MSKKIITCRVLKKANKRAGILKQKKKRMRNIHVRQCVVCTEKICEDIQNQNPITLSGCESAVYVPRGHPGTVPTAAHARGGSAGPG